MGHLARASPHPDESGQRDQRRWPATDVVDPTGEGEIGRRWLRAKEVADVVDRQARRKKRRSSSRCCARGRRAMDAGAPAPRGGATLRVVGAQAPTKI
jgi:hypothetical protein